MRGPVTRKRHGLHAARHRWSARLVAGELTPGCATAVQAKSAFSSGAVRDAQPRGLRARRAVARAIADEIVAFRTSTGGAVDLLGYSGGGAGVAGARISAGRAQRARCDRAGGRQSGLRSQRGGVARRRPAREFYCPSDWLVLGVLPELVGHRPGPPRRPARTVSTRSALFPTPRWPTSSRKSAGRRTCVAPGTRAITTACSNTNGTGATSRRSSWRVNRVGDCPKLVSAR